MALIACVDLDPFLVGLVRRVRPDDAVVEVDGSELAAGRTRRYAAVVMGAGNEALRVLEASPVAERTVLVAGEHDGWVPPAHPGPAVRRPVEAAELRLALGRVIPPGRFAAARARLGTLLVSTTTAGIFGVARVAAVAAASALTLSDAVVRPPVALVAALFAWTLVRVWVRESTAGLVGVDVFLAAGAILLTGGTESPYLLFAAVVSAEVGYAYRRGSAVTIVGVATAMGLVPLAIEVFRGRAAAPDLIGWGMLIPLSGLIGGLARRIQASQEGDQLLLLTELHRTLDRLSKQAQSVAGTLEINSVIDQVLASLREDLGAVGGALLVGEGTVHAVVGCFGLTAPVGPRVLVPTSRGRTPQVPDEVTAALPAGERLVARLRAMGADRGMVVVVLRDGAATREAEGELRALATQAAVALDNARLFEGIRELTVDEERRRLARDLHDGVIQSLVHVRFELDLVRRMLADEHAKEIHRLRDVVGQAVDEVRATVNDLRSVRLSAGLGTALLSVAREYERPGLRVVVDAAPLESLTPEAELQLLRIAQEAVSNAVHHGEAAVIYIRLWDDGTQVHLQVLDDGVGLVDGPIDLARGVGLRAMQERADLLGARLDLGPGADGGTCVQVDVPVGRNES